MAKTRALNAVPVFDATRIGTIGFLFEGEATALASDCNGTISTETEVQTIQKKCGATIAKSISRPTEVTVTVEAHLPVEIFRRIYGIKADDQLKEGVYAYGGESQGENFTLTVEVIDDFETETKLIAFPKLGLSSGLTFEIENGADEVAYLEVEAKASQDELGNWYYEALPTEATTVDKTEWLTNFTTATVKKTVSP